MPMELNNAMPDITESRDGEKVEAPLGAWELFLAAVYTTEHEEKAEEGAGGTRSTESSRLLCSQGHHRAQRKASDS